MNAHKSCNIIMAKVSGRILGGVSVLLILVASGVSACMAQSRLPLGYLEGELNFRGTSMGVRVNLESVGDSLSATLDIPSLIMAWEEIPATLNDDKAELDFPFGLGTLALELQGEDVRATKLIGDDTLSLHLEYATPPPFTRQDVQFTSGNIDLAGTLVLPNGEGPHPAVVLLHGSGRQGQDAWAYRSWADLLARQGLAVLYYDKRGVGSSEGDYGASLRQLADDGVAAVRYMRSRPELDPARIGLKGSSQGVWLAEQVASDLGDMAFLLLVSGAAGTPRDQELQKIEYGMRDDDRPEVEIEDALAYAGLYFYVVRTGEGWPLLEQAVKRAQNNEWGQYVDQPESENDLSWWRENHSLQPADLVNNQRLPVLLLYGGADWITPPVENADKLRSLFPSPDLVDVQIFPGADHRLEVKSGRDEEGVWHWPQVAPEMRKVLAKWLEENRLN